MANDKLIKNVIIARSGIYKYRNEEVPNLGLGNPPEAKEVYNVYRPALVLSRDKDKFSMLPLTNGHPNVMVDSENFKDLAIGFTGETVTDEWNKDVNEVVLKTRVALLGQKALDNYMTGVEEVSPGYVAEFEWQKGKTSSGEDYDAIMTSVTDGNHLAMTPKARGGSVARITDSIGGETVKLTSYLWRIVRKVLSGVKDDTQSFRSIADDISKNRISIKDEDLQGKVQLMKDMSSDLPDSDDKNVLSKFLDDYGIIKNKDEESAKLAADMISDLYEKLDSESAKGVQMDPVENKKEPPAAPNTNEAAKDDEGASGSPEEMFIEMLEQALMKYHSMKTGTGNPTESAAGNTPPVNQEKTPVPPPQNPPAPPTRDEGNVAKVEPPKKTEDSFGANITLDSGSNEGSLTDFFNSKVKGGR